MLVSGRYPTRNSPFDRLKIDAWKILLLPKFLGRKTIFSEMLCFVRNSGVGCFIWISLGFVGIPKNFGTWTICSRLPLDAKLLGTVIFPPSISLHVGFLQHMRLRRSKNPQLIGMSIRSRRFTTSTSRFVQRSNHLLPLRIRQHEAGIGTKRPFKSFLFQQLKIPIRWTSTCAILNLSPPKRSYASPPKRPRRARKNSSPRSYRPTDPTVYISIKGALRFLIIHLFSHRVILTGPCSSLCGRVGLPGPFHHVPGNTPGSFERALVLSYKNSRKCTNQFKIIFCTDWKISASCLYLI